MKRKKQYGQKKLVLLCGLSSLTARGAEVQAVLKENSVPFIELTVEQQAEKIGFLCGLYGYTASSFEKAETIPELMVFSGFDRTGLDKVLEGLRTVKITIALKAMVTRTNQDWTVNALYREIKTEHMLMQKLSTLRQKRNTISLDGQPEDALLRAAAHADVLLNGMKQPTDEEVTAVLKELDEATK